MIVLIAAGLTAIPAVLVGLTVLPMLALLLLPPLFLLKFRKASKKEACCNVIITGGSSGIGLAIAKECCQKPQVKSITLIARNMDTLQRAKNSLLVGETGEVEIQLLSADVTDYKQVQAISDKITFQETTYLFTCAGASHPGYFDKLTPNVFEKQMSLNYMGTVHAVKAFLPLMKSGTITLVSSGAGQIGVFGLTAYSPTKFALRGFAESLHMELSSSPISVQLAFPNDTNTPGYQQEQSLKPKECDLISQSAGLEEPQDIAKKMVRESVGVDNPNFVVWFGLEGWMLSALTAGMGPEPSLVAALTQVLLMGWFRFVSLFYLKDFWRIIRECANTRETMTTKKDQ